MDVKMLRQVVCRLLEQFVNIPNADGSKRDTLLIDTTGNHYQWLSIGWNGMQRIFDVYMHLDIRDNFIWIERNDTDIDIALELVARGVPKEQIVLGLQAPYKRKISGYATGELGT